MALAYEARGGGPLESAKVERERWRLQVQNSVVFEQTAPDLEPVEPLPPNVAFSTSDGVLAGRHVDFGRRGLTLALTLVTNGRLRFS